MDPREPLRRGTNVKTGAMTENRWIPITYEKLPDFCYWCGKLGHTLQECDIKGNIESDENLFGVGLKETQRSKGIYKVSPIETREQWGRGRGRGRYGFQHQYHNQIEIGDWRKNHRYEGGTQSRASEKSEGETTPEKANSGEEKNETDGSRQIEVMSEGEGRTEVEKDSSTQKGERQNISQVQYKRKRKKSSGGVRRCASYRWGDSSW